MVQINRLYEKVYQFVKINWNIPTQNVKNKVHSYKRNKSRGNMHLFLSQVKQVKLKSNSGDQIQPPVEKISFPLQMEP